MSTPTGVARCHFLAIGVKLAFGSHEEALAITDYNRDREIQMIMPIMAGASGERLNSVLKTWKNAIFPELKIGEVQRLKKYQDEFKKLKDVRFEVVL